MPNKNALSSPLQGKTIALPESRQLDILADLFERRGALVLRVPLVAILDAPEQAPVIAWIEDFVADPPDYLVLLTGEGLRRLLAAAERAGLSSKFIGALEQVCKICRGPKPGRALKEVGLKADLLGQAPTTAGIIETLAGESLEGKRVAVQLYGEEPNVLLRDYLQTRKLRACSFVAPYVYASDSDTSSVLGLIAAMASGDVDLIAFTSQPQVHRLFSVAEAQGVRDTLQSGLKLTGIAAIGPVVGDVLKTYGCKIAIMPESAFFMKPLVTAVERLFD